QDDGDLGLLRELERILPAGCLGGREQDHVDLVVDEGGEGIQLRLLIRRARRRRVLQVEARLGAERVLDGLLVRVAPAALRPDRDESDGGELVAAATAAVRGPAVAPGAAGPADGAAARGPVSELPADALVVL